MEKQGFDWDKLLSEVPPDCHKNFNEFRENVNQLETWFEASCLHMYAFYTNKPSLETLKMLLNAGNLINYTDECGVTVLHYAAMNKRLPSSTALYEMLTELGAEWRRTRDDSNSVLIQ